MTFLWGLICQAISWPEAVTPLTAWQLLAKQEIVWHIILKNGEMTFGYFGFHFHFNMIVFHIQRCW